MNGLAMGLSWAAGLAANECNLAEVERFATDLVELSTRHKFAFWLASGLFHRGWARSVSGDTAQGIALIDRGLRDYRATGAVLGLPVFLGRKAEALYRLYAPKSEALTSKWSPPPVTRVQEVPVLTTQ